jgi:hypothetical protein
MKYALLLIVSFSIFSLEAQLCFEDYTYLQPIQLKSNIDSTTIKAHTVAIPWNTKALVDAGKIAGDGSDIKVTDQDCNAIPFFIQGIEERENNILYVSVPDLDQDGITIQVYYGAANPQESQIDGESVFDFFDDFEDGTVDLDKWEVIGAYDLLEEANGELRFTGRFGQGGIFQYITPKNAYKDAITMDFAANANNSQVYGMADTADMKRIGLRYNSGLQSNDTLDLIALMNDTLSGGSNPGLDPYPNIPVTRNELNIISITAFLDESKHLNFTRFENHSTGQQNIDTVNLPQMEFEAMRPFFSSFSTPIKVEYIGIRPAISEVPEIILNEEVNLTISSTRHIASDFDIRLFPNPVQDRLQILTSQNVPERIRVINSLGQVALNTPYLEMIDVSTFSPGLYFIQLDLENGKRTIDQILIQ